MLSWLKRKPAKPGQNGEARCGPYTLHELINRGGMAEIWLASSPEHKSVALRRMRTDAEFGAKSKKAFLRGCEALARIVEHEHVIRYVEHGTWKGTPYLVMEYVEGANLRQLVQRADPSLEEFMAVILERVAAALMHIHDNGFIHLDVKPDNVVVTSNGDVRMVDFDLVQPKPTKPVKLDSNGGTPAYMAPEQLLKEPLDHRADIYAFGVTAYELLTFKHPFTGETKEEVLRNQLNRGYNLRPPREHNPAIPALLERIILKCLERDPGQRYPFMSVLVRDLELALKA